MRPLQVGNLLFGEGITKICVPIAYETEQEILQEAENIAAEPAADLAEWRIDWYTGVEDTKQLLVLLPKVKETLAGKPLLVTFRSRREGGEKEIAPEAYLALLKAVAAAGAAPELLDLELSAGEAVVKELTEAAHEVGISVIFSQHDFKKTPSVDEMFSVLEQMYRLGADVCKLAVMPQQTTDTAHLLEVTARMKDQYPQSMTITMSMGKIGAISRICGGAFGSVMTFGCLGKASAPGQVSVKELKQALLSLQQCEG